MAHYLVLIHGIGEGDPIHEYETLFDLIGDEYCRHHKLKRSSFEQFVEPIFVDWINVTRDAERTIFRTCFPDANMDAIKCGWGDALLDPQKIICKLRFFMTYFVGDIAAYAVAKGHHAQSDHGTENTIRMAAWDEMGPPLKALNATYSLVAHSLGSVIAFDYLFHLFVKDMLFVGDDEVTPEVVQKLKENFSSLFTFGSPIALFMLRKSKLWKGHRKFHDIVNPVFGTGRTWLNFYDEQDIIAYPLANLFNKGISNADRFVKDIIVNTGATPFDSHISYWRNHDLTREIACALPSPQALNEFQDAHASKAVV